METNSRHWDGAQSTLLPDSSLEPDGSTRLLPVRHITPPQRGHACLEVLTFGNGQTNLSIENVKSKQYNDSVLSFLLVCSIALGSEKLCLSYLCFMPVGLGQGLQRGEFQRG